MAITRDANYPPEIAQLFQAFNRCSEGHDSTTVLQASANFLVAAINMHTQLSGRSADYAVRLATQISDQVPRMVGEQWMRPASDEDVVVPLRGN